MSPDSVQLAFATVELPWVKTSGVMSWVVVLASKMPTVPWAGIVPQEPVLGGVQFVPPP